MAYNPTWSGNKNGAIPFSKLAVVPNFAPLGGQYAQGDYGSNRMKPEAAAQVSGLMQAFWKRFKRKLLLREGYRPVDPVQNWYYNRFMKKLPGWTLAAFPGTSNHGWGLSADFGVGPDNRNFNAEEMAWMRANAPLYGLLNDVASEVWHWTFRGTVTIRINNVINDPNQDSLVQAVTGGNMFILFEHAKRGQALGGPGFFHGLTSEEAPWAGAISYVHIVCVNERHFDLIKAMCTGGASVLDPRIDNVEGILAKGSDSVRSKIDALPGKVWSTLIDAPENGKQSAAARTAGADMGRNVSDAAAAKIAAAVVKTLPASSGGSAPSINEDSLAKKVVDLMHDRLQS